MSRFPIEAEFTLCDVLNPKIGYQVKINRREETLFASRDPVTGNDLLTARDCLDVIEAFVPPKGERTEHEQTWLAEAEKMLKENYGIDLIDTDVPSTGADWFDSEHKEWVDMLASKYNFAALVNPGLFGKRR